MLQSLKNYSTEKIVSLLLSMATNSSNENLVRMTYLMELIPKKDYYRERIRWIRQLIRENHPSIEFPRRILRDLHPNQRDKWITNLAVNHLLSGTNKRKAWAEREGYYPPSTVVISPTMRCNLSCYGCYAGDYDKSLELSLEEIDSVLIQMKEMGVYFAVISGGEPFFKEDIFDIFKKHCDMAFLVFTHGGLIDEQMVERLIEVGNVMPAFSLEGYEQETDERRGAGSFPERSCMPWTFCARRGFPSAAHSPRPARIPISSPATTTSTCCWKRVALPSGSFPMCRWDRKPDLALMPTPEQRDLMRRRTADFRAIKADGLRRFLERRPDYQRLHRRREEILSCQCQRRHRAVRLLPLCRRQYPPDDHARKRCGPPFSRRYGKRRGNTTTCCVPAC